MGRYISIILASIILLFSYFIYSLINLESLGIPYNKIKQSHTNYNKINQIESKQIYDFIIIGGGTAGCILAARLSENAEVSVLLLEAGGADDSLSLKIPLAFSKLFRSAYDWNFNSEPQAKLSGNTIFNPRGKVLGGSGSMNAMIYMRGSGYDYDKWEELGNKGWGWKEVLPYFKKSEGIQNPFLSDEFHNKTGPWKITEGKPDNLQKAFMEALNSELGLPIKEDINGEHYATEGVGINQFNIINGSRHSLSDAFLTEEVLQRKNLYIKLNSEVTKILFNSDNKAIGVEVAYSETNKENIYCSKEVILSAGAIKSPQILMLSGIGDKEELIKHNINVLYHNKEVGKNLQDHLTIGFAFTSRRLEDTLHLLEYKFHEFKALYNWLFYKDGSLTSNSITTNAVFRSTIAIQNNEPAPDIQLLAASVIIPFSNKLDLTTKSFPNGGFGIGVCLLAPKSRGYVALRSGDYKDSPIIDNNVFGEKEDEIRIITALNRVAKIKSNQRLANYIDKQLFINTDYIDPMNEESTKQLHPYYFNMYHPVGTCAMGTVVDEKLKVKGVKSLRIIDASIMPLITRGNTNAPVAMISEKGADMIKLDYGLN